jgi:phage shock protein A
MGIFGKIKGAFSSKANSALDKAIDPEKELDMAIMELEEGRKHAIAELISYKATAKTMEQDIAEYERKRDSWEKRAMEAVRAGDDELAREALTEKKRCEVEIAKIRHDKDEAASYAIQLNKSRKTFETKLKMLKLRKGTMAAQMKAARSGGDNPFSTDGEAWEKFRRAEEKIDEEAIAAEVDAIMEGDAVPGGISAAEFDQRLLEAGGKATDPDDALSQLKAKMDADKATKKLTE